MFAGIAAGGHGAVRLFAAVAMAVAFTGCSPSMDTRSPSPSPSPIPTLSDAAVASEVVELHAFFQAWFRGELAADDAAFAPLAQALGPGFVIISPSGTAMSRAAVLDGVRGAHGSWGPDDRIWIDAVTIRHRDAETVVATYEEWQRRGGDERGRVSTVVFSADGVWLHLQETWLP